jgi:hypothetical protein
MGQFDSSSSEQQAVRVVVRNRDEFNAKRQELVAAGLKVDALMPIIGAVTGTISRRDLKKLDAIEGIEWAPQEMFEAS